MKKITIKVVIVIITGILFTGTTAKTVAQAHIAESDTSRYATKDSTKIDFNKQNKLQEVAVHGRTIMRELKESPLPVEVLDLKPIHGQIGNMVELLNRAPGIRLRTDGAIGDGVNISLNGLDGKSIVLFKDGIPSEFFGHSFSPSLIPSNMLDRVEIYKGALPINLGADALGGAVNFVSSAPSERRMEVSYEVGSFNTHRATASAYLPSKDNRWFGGLNTALTYSDNNYKLHINGYRAINPDSDPETFTAFERYRNNAVYAPFVEAYGGARDQSWADELRITLISSIYDRRLPQMPGVAAASINYNALHSFIEDRTISPLLQYRKGLFENKLYIDALLGYSLSKTHFADTARNGVLGEGRTGEISRTGHDMKVDYKFYTGRFNVTYALGKNHQLQANYIQTDYGRIGMDTIPDPAYNAITREYYYPLESPADYKKQVGAFGIKSQFLDKRLENLAAVKYYRMSGSGYSTYGMGGNEKLEETSSETWGWMEGISYRPTNSWLFKASYEYATRLPDHFELFGDSYQIRSHFGLKPEQSHNLNLQGVYNWRSQTHLDRSFTLAVNLFNRNTRDMIILFRDIPYDWYRNWDRVKSKGFELDVFYRPIKEFSISANGTYIDINRVNINGGTGEELAWFKATDVSPILANLHGRVYLENLVPKGHNLELFWYWNYMHRYTVNWVPGTPYLFDLGLFEKAEGNLASSFIPGDGRIGQQQHSVGFIYHIPNPKLSISGEVNNLTNQLLFDNMRMQKPTRGFTLKLRWIL